jgi:hypothetical protein
VILIDSDHFDIDCPWNDGGRLWDKLNDRMRGWTPERTIETCHYLHASSNLSRVDLVEELGVEISADRRILGKLCLQKFGIFPEMLKHGVVRLRVDGLDLEEK